MRKPAGLVISGILLGLLALAGIALGASALSISAIVHRPLLPKIPGVRPGLWLILSFCLLCLWTVADLFRMRRWTRPAMVVIGLVVCVFSALAGVGLLWMRDFAVMLASVLLQGNYLGAVQAAIIGVAAVYFLIAVAGLWWAVYFSRARVRAAFVQHAPSADPRAARAGA